MTHRDLAARVGRVLRVPVATITPAGSSGYSDTFRATLDSGRSVFVKAGGGPAGMFAAEAAGLRWMAETRAVRSPDVLAVHDPEPGTGHGSGNGHADSNVRFAVMTWIEQQLPAPDHDEQLGRDLARLHRSGAPGFGFDHDNFIADLPQSNRATDTWPEFYGYRRLEPMARRALDAGALSVPEVALVDRVIAKLDDLVGPDEVPSRLHGDLWRGNVLAGQRGEPWLIDPAVYGGHREVDLAMMKLFGGFSAPCFDAYAEAHPLADGHLDRVSLYQLYPLLVHVVLFGSSYRSSLMQAVRAYA